MTFWKRGPPPLFVFFCFFFPVFFCFWEQRYVEQPHHCTITRRSQCLTPHHLETVVGSLKRKSHCSLIQCIRSASGRTSSILHVCDSGPVHFISVLNILEAVLEDLKPHAGGFVCFSMQASHSQVYSKGSMCRI